MGTFLFWLSVFAKPWIEPPTSCSQVRNATDWALGLDTSQCHHMQMTQYANDFAFQWHHIPLSACKWRNAMEMKMIWNINDTTFQWHRMSPTWRVNDTIIYRGHLFFSVKDRNLFHRVDTIGVVYEWRINFDLSPKKKKHPNILFISCF